MRVLEYVEQHPDFALGNFIHLTPTLRYLSEKRGMKIPVLFRTDYVKEAFLDCPFIEHIDRPGKTRMFGSNITNQANDRPDYEYIFQTLTGRIWNKYYHTYVDTPPPVEDGLYIVIVNGAGNTSEGYVQSKDPGASPYMIAMQKCRTIAVGSKEDFDRCPYLYEADEYVVGDMRLALSYIHGARAVIANDTGLYHAAGAMNVPTLALWKNTLKERCKNAGVNTEYAYENHDLAVDRFLTKHLYI